MKDTRKYEQWTTNEIPLLEGRVVIVTGANSGVGFFTAKALALKGAKVIMACRNIEKGEVARQRIMIENSAMEPEVWLLDLASLDSVKAFAKKIGDSFVRIDLLINNAGLMAIPYRETREGFEMQFGVNHLGHFALTALLWPNISETPESRIVNVGSAAHHMGRIRFEDIHWKKEYSKWGAYLMSKLSNLLFTHELSGRLKATGKSVMVISAHPGYTDTELLTNSARMRGSKLGVSFYKLANKLVAQPAEMGALSILYAATSIDVKQGAYYGPGGFMRLKGWPAPERPNPKRVTDDAAGKLWGLSETLTGLRFPV